MLRQLITLFLLLISILFAGCVDNQKEEIPPEQLMASADSVVVEYDYIKFIFDIERKDTWEWFLEKSDTGTLEYQWMASFNFEDEGYSAGFSLFKYPGAEPASGSFDELVEAGQVSLWRAGVMKTKSSHSNMTVMSGRRTLVRNAEINATVENDKLVIMLKEEYLVNKFSNFRPDSVSYMTKTQRSNFESKQQAVSYPNNEANF
ncbi:MAG: hypothetical protein CL670_11575 [Balneola sp.]|jgi:hypothetical protein|nr:hypothetical protein [Balneola sp.]MBE79787.1 hypothetical protein [Balneola sp.]HBX65914.1 hypothetical protein [Balneolaceae bacterium]|tara:strand:- start:1237 stop:1848 length:612 start_codon:yes stop_codon:yes gene_type:complete